MNSSHIDADNHHAFSLSSSPWKRSKIACTVISIALMSGLSACSSSDDDPADVDEIPADNPAPSDLPAAVAEQLARTFSIVNGDTLETAVALASRLTDAATETGRMPSGADVPATVISEIVDYDCNDGGTAQTTDQVESDGFLRERNFTFSECVIGSYRIDGTMRSFSNRLPVGALPPAPYSTDTAATSYTSINVDYVDVDTNRSVAIAEGQVYVNYPDESPDSVGLNVNWAATPQPIVITDSTGTTSIANLAVASTWTNTDAGLYNQHTFSGLAISVSGDGAGELDGIVFDEPFSESTGDAYFQTGKLSVSGSGFDYEIDAANGDPATFLLNVTENGVITGYTVPWSSRFDLNEFDPSNVDVGL